MSVVMETGITLIEPSELTSIALPESIPVLTSQRCDDKSRECDTNFEPVLPLPFFQFPAQRPAKDKDAVSLGSITSAVSLELCCGSAGLSAELKKLGLDSLGVDWIRNPQRPKSTVLKADLASKEGQDLITTIVREGRVRYKHSAPPCGTASRAREKRLPQFLLDRGAPAPRQLRSAEKPMGLPGLSPSERLRVDLANLIYAFIAFISTLCHNMGILWSVENPLTSYLWLIPFMIDLMNLPGVYVFQFQQCMHGGTRPVWRRWITNIKSFEALVATCDNSHVHESFNIGKHDGHWKFDTATEATYPKVLCQRVARLVHDALISKGFVALATSITEADEHFLTKRNRQRASVGLFVRGNRLPEVITEFESIAEFPSSAPRAISAEIKFQDSYGKVLRHKSGGDGGAQFEIIGLYRTPAQFNQCARKLRHPIDLCTSSPDVLKQNIFWVLTSSQLQVAKFRCEQLSKLHKRAVELSGKELLSREGLSPQTIKVLKGKNLLLLREVLQECHYPDVEVVDEILRGMNITGAIPPSGIFPEKLRTPSITAQQLKESGKFTRRGTLASMRSSGSLEIDSKVWNETLEEVSAGWMDGPFSEGQLSDIIGNDFIVNRRFGLQQGSKVRSIDDLSESGVNSTVLTFERIELMGVDEYLAVAKIASSAVSDDRKVCIQLDNGSYMKGTLHSSITTTGMCTWVGKTFDLKSAYRQIPTRASEAWANVIAVWNPFKLAPELFLINALPFGGVGSVYGFNRASRAVWAAVNFLMRTVLTNFYDDYPALELSHNAAFADDAIKSTFAILGWTLSLEEKKCRKFSPSFEMLGVVMDLSDMNKRKISVSNKADRLGPILMQLDEIVSASRCSTALAAEVIGRSQFAANQIFGRMAAGALQELRVHQYTNRSGIIGEMCRAAILDLRLIFTTAVPRTLDFKGEQRPLLVYSDGACEGEDRNVVSIGAVIYDTISNKSVMFGKAVPGELVKEWKLEGVTQTIGQAELLPVLMSKLTLPGLFAHRRIFYFIDNDSARMAMIRGHSPSASSHRIISSFFQDEAMRQTWSWFARIASHSNPGDGPSRLRLIPAAENLFSEEIEMATIPRGVFRGFD